MGRRLCFVLISALAGTALFVRAEEADWGFLLVGFAIGGGTGGLIVAGEYALQRASFGVIVGGTAGLIVGLLLTGLVEWVGSAVFDVETFLFHIGGLVFLLGLPYLGLSLGARFGREKLGGGGPSGGEFMLQQDPPNHTRLRKLVSKAFTPRATESWRPRVREITDALLAPALEAGEIELIGGLAQPLPSQLICEMLGVPVADRGDGTVGAWRFAIDPSLTDKDTLELQLAIHLVVHIARVDAHRRVTELVAVRDYDGNADRFVLESRLKERPVPEGAVI